MAEMYKYLIPSRREVKAGAVQVGWSPKSVNLLLISHNGGVDQEIVVDGRSDLHIGR